MRQKRDHRPAKPETEKDDDGLVRFLRHTARKKGDRRGTVSLPRGWV